MAKNGKTEADITKEIKDYLDRLPKILYWKQWQGGRRGKSFSAPGVSDIIGCIRGRFFAIEVKTPGHKTEKERLKSQVDFLLEVELAGGIGIMVESVDEVMKYIK